ncbi:MAG: hypothetical protein AAFQ82_07300 [Myxococcota bacterium]
MSQARRPTQELEAALSVLEEVSSVYEIGDALQPGQVPPPLPESTKRSLEGEFTGRTEFPDLFKAETVGGDVSRMTPEEKVGFFRQKLKISEEQLTRFKDAWQIRTRELDHLEVLLANSRTRFDQNQERLGQLETFLDEKRSELDRYARSVAEAFKEQEEKENSLREQLADELAEGERLRDEAMTAERSRDEINRERSELLPRLQELEQKSRSDTEALEDARGEIAMLRKRLESRDAQLEEVKNDFEETEARLRNAAANRDEELTARIAELKEEVGGLEAQLIPMREDAEEWQARAEAAEADALSKHNQLIARDELISHYRDQAESAQAEARQTPPPKPPSAVDPEVLSALRESVEFAGRSLSAVIKGDSGIGGTMDRLREILKRLKTARTTLEELAKEP